jgi:hypothetical protein
MESVRERIAVLEAGLYNFARQTWRGIWRLTALTSERVIGDSLAFPNGSTWGGLFRRKICASSPGPSQAIDTMEQPGYSDCQLGYPRRNRVS